MDEASLHRDAHSPVSDANGDASSANYVLTATEQRLEDLPGVHVQNCRSSFHCR